MSRCFPYPPPGYVKNGISDEALIEAIKLKREEEKVKKERKKEKKREKKEKKREKKEKEKAHDNRDDENKKHSRKRRLNDERSREDQKGGDCQKGVNYETEHFEKSSLTEEHGHPVGSQNSSDSTLNSNKRQKLSSPADDRHNSGSIIRIRLPLQRHKDPKVLPSKDQPCSALGRIDDASVQRVHEPASVPGRERGEHPCSTSRNTGQDLTSRLSKENTCPSSRASKNFNHLAKPEPDLPTNLCGSCPLPLALKFRDLVENWVPLDLQIENTSLGDQDWLFETKQMKNQHLMPKKCDIGNNVDLNQGNPTHWLRACHLPEADIYALPYTIPF